MMGPFSVRSNQQAMSKNILYRNNYIGKTQEDKECNKSKREGNITGSEVVVISGKKHLTS